MFKQHLIRAKNSEPMSRDQYRHESNAFWNLVGQIKYLSESDNMKGHELNKYGKHVIKRLQEITAEVKSQERY
jgi:hypothetical protein|tara:strand:- start:28 stop:246 length:219 start_codon:yes stop_codon:yes gene_type:complete